MVYYIDIDDTIFDTPDGEYEKSKPICKAIDEVNRIYETGDTVVLWTARGTVTKIDWEELTKRQLQEFGVKYHELRFGKPAFDVFIDDKALNAENWRKSIK